MHVGRAGDRAAWSRTRIATLGAAGVLALAILVSVWPARPGAGPIARTDRGSEVRPDYGSTVLYPARAVLHGVNPYDWSSGSEYRERYPAEGSFLYSPHWVVLSIPFAAMGDVAGDKVFLVISALGVIGLVAVGLDAAKGRLGWVALCLISAAAMVATPTRNEFSLGQASIIVSLGFVAALAYRTRNPALASAGVFFALTKPQAGLPLLIALLALGAWRPVVYGTAAAAIVSLPIIIAGAVSAGSMSKLLSTVTDSFRFNQSDSSVGLGRGARGDLAAQIWRLTGWFPSDAVGLCITAVVVAVMAAALVRVVRTIDSSSLQAEGLVWLIAVGAALLAASQAYGLMKLIGLAALVCQEVTASKVVPAAWVQRAYIGFVAFVALIVRQQVGERLGWDPPFPDPQSLMVGFATTVAFVAAVIVVYSRFHISPREPAPLA